MSQSAHSMLKARRTTLEDSVGGGKVVTFAAMVRRKESENMFRMGGSEVSGSWRGLLEYEVDKMREGPSVEMRPSMKACS